MKAQYPEKAHKEVISELGKIWGRMNIDDRKQYEDKATTDKARYNMEKIEYEKLKQSQLKKSVEKA